MTFAFFSFLRFVYKTKSPLIFFVVISFAQQILNDFLKFRVSGPCFFHTSNEILTYIFNITHIIMLFECFGSKKFMTWRCPKRPVWPPSKTDTILTQTPYSNLTLLVKSDPTPFWTFFLLTSQSKLLWFL